MNFDLNTDNLYIVYSVCGAFIILFGLISLLIKERLFLSEPLILTTVGTLLGPNVIGLVSLSFYDADHNLTLEFSRIVIALQVTAAGISLPKKYIWHNMRSLFVMFVPLMFAKWMIGALFMFAIFPLSFLECLVISACITPTDPILANTIVKGKFANKYVPVAIRDLLCCESGANDGFALPYLYISIYLLKSDTVGIAITSFVLHTLLYQVLLAVAVGIITGVLTRKVIYFCERNDLIDKESFLAFWIALAVFLMGVMSILGSSDLLCCFVAGTAFAWNDWFVEETKESHIQEVIDMLFNYAYFIYLGNIIPWKLFNLEKLLLVPWRLILLAVLVLLFRRLPVILILSRFITCINGYREIVFAGWFGPIGVGAIFYAIDASQHFDNQDNIKEYIYPIVFFIVLCSIFIHGITVPLFYIGKRLRTKSFTNPSTSNFVSRLPQVRKDSFSQPRAQESIEVSA